MYETAKLNVEYTQDQLLNYIKAKSRILDYRRTEYSGAKGPEYSKNPVV